MSEPGRALQRLKIRGFTLVELLVVIAVITILAAMLLPALNRAKTAADSAVCINNLRQLVIALSTYTVDFNAYPSGGIEWDTGLQPYTVVRLPDCNFSWQPAGPGAGGSEPFVVTQAVTGVYACPGYNRMPGGFQPHLDGAYGYNFMGVVVGEHVNEPVLGLGGEYFSDQQTPILYRTVKSSEVVAPSRMVAIGDANIRPGLPYPVPGPPAIALGNLELMCMDDGALLSDQRPPAYVIENLPTSVLAYSALLKRRHGGLWNTVFCDGHVDKLRSAALHQSNYTYFNNDILKLWNLDNLPHQELAVPP